MTYFRVTGTPAIKPLILRLTGLCLIALTADSISPVRAQAPLDNVIRQHANGGKMTVITAGLDGVFHVKNELGVSPEIGHRPRQHVAPRLQSRIRKNTEFAAFVKLVKATSDRDFSPQELRKLYLSYKEWSQRQGAPGQ
ncbi:MAG: hypothetical protein AAF299_16765 [Pseudomonadota bacterium]